MTLDLSQIGGVDDTKRYPSARWEGRGADYSERLLTDGEQNAGTEMDVFLKGDNARTRVISQQRGPGTLYQVFYPRLWGLCLFWPTCPRRYHYHGQKQSPLHSGDYLQPWMPTP